MPSSSSDVHDSGVDSRRRHNMHQGPLSGPVERQGMMVSLAAAHPSATSKVARARQGLGIARTCIATGDSACDRGASQEPARDHWRRRPFFPQSGDRSACGGRGGHVTYTQASPVRAASVAHCLGNRHTHSTHPRLPPLPRRLRASATAALNCITDFRR